MTKGPKRKTVSERFWAKVQKSDGCWIWTGGTQRGGYGHFNKRSDDPVTSWRAHRVAYELSVGPIPDGMNLCHTCDNRKCVRPDHMFLGMQKDNIADMYSKGRNYVPDQLEECKRGHRDFRTKPNGKRYCHPCNLASSQRSRGKAKLG